MRILVLPLSALLCLIFPLLAQAQDLPAGATSDLYIPSILQKGIRSDKARPGDKVSFGLIESILIGKGVVIPASARLYGHVVEARAVTTSSESRLSVEVDRAEWRHHELPLHAFIYGLGIRRVKYDPNHSDCDPTRIGEGALEPRIPQQGFAQVRGEPACDTPWDSNDEAINLNDSEQLRHVLRETNHRDGSTTLTSKLRNVHLSAGVLIMLHNVPLRTTPGRLEVAARGQ